MFPDGVSPDARWIWLSHVLTENTPAYGGAPGLRVELEKSIDRGDSCNAARLALSNHLGSHVDAPRHFISGGKSVDAYDAAEWIYSRPAVLDIPMPDAGLITPEEVDNRCGSTSPDTDLLLIRTGFERRRYEECYWRTSPVFSAALAATLRRRFPRLSAVGMDCVSLSSLQDREEGRRAHRAFLERDIRILEDLSLAVVPAGAALHAVVALPLRFAGADGAPCSIIGLVD